MSENTDPWLCERCDRKLKMHEITHGICDRCLLEAPTKESTR